MKKTSTENSKTGKISIVGLGKLGACTLVALASKGFEVIGIDVNKDTVDKINKGIPPIYEPALEPLLKLYKDRIKATIYHEEIKETDMTIFIVPTPSLPDGSFSTEYLEAAILETGRCLPDSKKYHNFVVTSTVLPGDMETKIKPLLEQCTNKKVGKELGLCYNPDFIALGNVINGLLSPDMVLIGESDPRAGDMVEQMHIHLTGVEITEKLSVSQTPIHRMSLYNAELAKISLNAYVTMKISFANTITQICGEMPTGDAEKVLNAIGDDTRIGKKCLKSGLSFGGPCLLPSTLIQTNRGLKRIDSIKVGEQVLTHRGKYCRVTKTFERAFMGNLIEITPEGFPQDKIITTPEHPILGGKRINNQKTRFRITNGKPRLSHMIGHSDITFIPANLYEVGDILAIPLLKEKSENLPSFFLREHHKSKVKKNNIITPELMRLFGFYIAEGCTWKKAIQFSFHAKELGYVQDISDIIYKYFGAKTEIKERRGNGIRTRTTCTSLAEYLKKQFGGHSYEKHFPYDWLGLPEEYLIELARGIWYGDGSKSCNRFTLGITSLELFNSMKLLLLKLGIAFTTKKYKSRVGKDGTKHRESYFIKVSNQPFITMMNKLLPNLTIELNTRGKGKKTVWIENNNMLYHIRKIKTIPYTGNVYNLEVENANSYMLEGAVVHNCFPRDNKAFSHLLYPRPALSWATDTVNDMHIDYVTQILKDLMEEHHTDKIAILGLTYKPDTNITEESAAIRIIKKLDKLKRIDVYDPSMPPVELPKNVTYCVTPEECINNHKICFIATPWKQFKEIYFKRAMWKNPAILDAWGLLPHLADDPDIDYRRLGKNVKT